MANTVTTQLIADNTKNAIVHVYVASDGASGELSDQVIVDVSALAGSPSKVRIIEISGSASGFSGVLEWDATTDVPFFNIPTDREFKFCYERFAGLQNNAGAGVTGDITLTTSGFTASGDRGHITFVLAKS